MRTDLAQKALLALKEAQALDAEATRLLGGALSIDTMVAHARYGPESLAFPMRQLLSAQQQGVALLKQAIDRLSQTEGQLAEEPPLRAVLTAQRELYELSHAAAKAMEAKALWVIDKGGPQSSDMPEMKPIDEAELQAFKADYAAGTKEAGLALRKAVGEMAKKAAAFQSAKEALPPQFPGNST